MKKLQVRDLMSREIVVASPGDSVARVRNQMYEHWVRYVPIVGAEKALLGLVTYRDLLRRSLIEQGDQPVWVEEAQLEQIRAEDVMQRNVDLVEAETDLTTAGQLLLDTKKGCLLVVEEAQLVGMLSESDFVRHVVAELAV